MRLTWIFFAFGYFMFYYMQYLNVKPIFFLSDFFRFHKKHMPFFIGVNSSLSFPCELWHSESRKIRDRPDFTRESSMPPESA